MAIRLATRFPIPSLTIVTLALKRYFAIFSLCFLLQAAVPAALFAGDQTSASAMTQNPSPLAEEEDENSDVNLKFLVEPVFATAPTVTFHYLNLSEPDVIAHIDDTPTPPPL